MKILDTKPVYKAGKGGRVFLTMYERSYEHNGHEGLYFMVGRGEEIAPLAEKRPDAVVIVAVHSEPNQPNRLVLTSEFRVPVGGRELGFPAGLIEQSDFDAAHDWQNAAKLAAIREVKEETGLIFQPIDASPPNLYSSAGLTNESITLVIGTATGTPCADGCERDEDIEVILATQEDLRRLMYSHDYAHSKTAWPFIWHFAQIGLTF